MFEKWLWSSVVDNTEVRLKPALVAPAHPTFFLWQRDWKFFVIVGPQLWDCVMVPWGLKFLVRAHHNISAAVHISLCQSTMLRYNESPN